MFVAVLGHYLQLLILDQRPSCLMHTGSRSPKPTDAVETYLSASQCVSVLCCSSLVPPACRWSASCTRFQGSWQRAASWTSCTPHASSCCARGTAGASRSSCHQQQALWARTTGGLQGSSQVRRVTLPCMGGGHFALRCVIRSSVVSRLSVDLAGSCCTCIFWTDD